MLNAYGCICKNLQEAMDFFESSKEYFPAGYDAVVYEAMLNVITVHRRPDLISVYLAKMVDGRVHMTAYVVNVVTYAIERFSTNQQLTERRSCQVPANKEASPDLYSVN
ncbi:hypothetical protein CPB85DRAFT_119980 [Mucidula mucida]|nr:hypothetical protein CPB85DRAFT_119980 [Mucidula mucida]